ncbi:MAG: hypothetical protein LBD90_08335 [Bifidobacteriaceae bacterium]|jgi:hypothetical protein|nr:hypothetical protein [Bifidobacteriaceae bacterium]
MTINQAALAAVPVEQRAGFAASRPSYEIVETGDDQRVGFADWLASGDGQAWLDGQAGQPSGQPNGRAGQPTGTQALLDEARRHERALAGASRGQSVIRINLPLETAGQLLRANPALAWVIGQLDTKRDRDLERPSPSALAAALLAAATLHAADIEHADPDITWQAARQATTAAADAVRNADHAVDDLRDVLEGLGDKIAGPPRGRPGESRARWPPQWRRKSRTRRPPPR